MIITNFKINNMGPLEIMFPNLNNIQLNLSIEWTNHQNNADLNIIYSVQGNRSNICFINNGEQITREHKSIFKVDTIKETLTFSICGNIQAPDDQFELKATAKIDDVTSHEEIITVLISN